MYLSEMIAYVYLNYIDKIVDYLTYQLPGKKVIPIRYIINIQKGSTCLYVLFLMYYYNNWSASATIYLSLHGTYGFIWLLKDRIIPDSAWEHKTSILSILFIFVLVLGPYWVAPYLLISSHITLSNWIILLAISIHTLGCVLMMSSDTQKYWILKYRKGLINNGWFARSRNTNYLGEMMIYSSYALLSQHHTSWYILGYIWSILFARNIIKKEYSLKKKDGWNVYKSQSNCLFPKISGIPIMNKFR